MTKELFLNKSFMTGALALALAIPTTAMVAYASDEMDKDDDTYIEISAEDQARYTQALEAAGYKVIEIEAEEDDGKIEVEAEVTKDGVEYDVYLDATTAEIVEVEKDA